MNKPSCDNCKWLSPNRMYLSEEYRVRFAFCHCPKNRSIDGDSIVPRGKDHRHGPAWLTRFTCYVVGTCGPQGRWWEKKSNG